MGSRAASPTSCRANHLFVFPTARARAADGEGGRERKSESESRRSSEVHPDAAGSAHSEASLEKTTPGVQVDVLEIRRKLLVKGQVVLVKIKK